MFSIVSMPPCNRMTGVPLFVVDFSGRGRFNPQSPLFKEYLGVSMAARVGYGSVAVSDRLTTSEVGSAPGGGIGGGRLNSLEWRSRLAAGESLAAAAITAVLLQWIAEQLDD